MSEPSSDAVAAIDIGTNSVLLLIAREQNGQAEVLCERATITRLGKGVDRSRRLDPEATQRTLECLQDYAHECARHHVSTLRVVGTSALRDASGSEAFLRQAQRVLGQRPRVISGALEAALTFEGALSGLDLSGAVTVLDIGGGSTELISADSTRREVSWAKSLDIGSVRLFERHLAADPPLASELEALARDARSALATLPRPDSDAVLVGVAGTVTTLAAIAAAIDPYDPSRIHGAWLPRADLEALAVRLGGMSRAERAQLPGCEPGRADVIVAGAALAREVASWANASGLRVSDRGLRWGIVERLLGGNDDELAP